MYTIVDLKRIYFIYAQRKWCKIKHRPENEIINSLLETVLLADNNKNNPYFQQFMLQHFKIINFEYKYYEIKNNLFSVQKYDVIVNKNIKMRVGISLQFLQKFNRLI